jgi:glycosyltransferase involved in cell wall biosynthesis
MKKKIRVLHTEWSLGWGGQEIRIIQEMLAVRELGVEVFLACRADSIIRKRAEEEKIPVFTLPFRGNVDIVTLVKLAILIRKYNIDIVNTHSGKDTWVGGLAAKLAGVKFIRTRHLSNPINPSRLNFINELADFVITTGESVREDMIHNNRISPDKIQSIPTGVDATRYSPDCCDRNEARKELGLQDHQFAIGILAVLRSFKRHDHFIEAARLVMDKYPDMVFLIAGEGAQEKNIKALLEKYRLKDRIRMLGHTEKGERFLRALDLFVLSSDSKEGVPQSVIQALMMGLPVIATDVGSTKDLFQGNNFYLVEPSNIHELSQAMEQIYQNENLRIGYAKHARNSVKDFTRNIMGIKILQIYQRLLQLR